MWRQKRNWGHILTVPGIIGLVMLMMADGPDMVRANQQNSLEVITMLAITSGLLLGVGWFINHCPTQRAPARIRRDWDQYDPE